MLQELQISKVNNSNTTAKKKLLKIYLPNIGTVFHISPYAQKDKSSEKN
jgi:hypothetical protein